jgi:predicted DNA-binding transcriptional regulator AlpA
MPPIPPEQQSPWGDSVAYMDNDRVRPLDERHQTNPRAPPFLLRYTDLVAHGIVRNRITLKNWIEKRGFPKGRLIGPNTRAWTEAEVANWLASRPSENKQGPIKKNLEEGHHHHAERAP